MKTHTAMQWGAACAILALGLALPACDRKVVETTKTQEGPNGVTQEKKTVVEHNDGTITQEKETHTTTDTPRP